MLEACNGHHSTNTTPCTPLASAGDYTANRPAPRTKIIHSPLSCMTTWHELLTCIHAAYAAVCFTTPTTLYTCVCIAQHEKELKLEIHHHQQQYRLLLPCFAAAVSSRSHAASAMMVCSPREAKQTLRVLAQQQHNYHTHWQPTTGLNHAT